MTWTSAKQRQMAAAHRRNILVGRHAAAQQMERSALTQAQNAQDRLNAAEAVREILDRLQQREHERAVGAYEELLTAFLSDVLPGERSIVMDLHTERGAPALDVFVRKGENAPLEDAWLGTGGSVTNLLSTGLRLIALLRSGQRRFLVLDESDCWIKPDLIPRYAQVVSQMSRDLDVQILMISHHDESLFAQHIPHRLRLEKLSGGLLTTEWSPTSQLPDWTEEQTGIRSIILNNFQSHDNTCVFLSPQVTLLQGDNDVGKSAVVNALRAVFDGDSNDTLIKHHAPTAKVVVDCGPDHVLVWQRHRKGKVKTSYLLTNTETQEIIRSSEGTKIPEWVKEHVKIGQVDDLDIQIGQQQDPVFLLNQPASQRAKALAIGQESGHVNTMMLIDRSEVQDAKQTLKTAERTLEALRHQMRVFEDLGVPLGPDEVCNTTPVEDAVGRAAKITETETLLQKWKRAQRHTERLAGLGQSISLGVPELKAGAVSGLLTTWRHAYRVADACQGLGRAPIWRVPVAQVGATDVLAARWLVAEGKMGVLAQLRQGRQIVAPTLHDTGSLARVVGQWKAIDVKLESAGRDMTALSEELATTQEELADTFPTCPTCEQAWDHHNSAHGLNAYVSRETSER